MSQNKTDPKKQTEIKKKTADDKKPADEKKPLEKKTLDKTPNGEKATVSDKKEMKDKVINNGKSNNDTKTNTPAEKEKEKEKKNESPKNNNNKKMEIETNSINEENEMDVDESNIKSDPKNEGKSAEEIEEGKSPLFIVGDEVLITKDRMGIIKFKGKVPELGNYIFYGIELIDGSVGYNDGQVKGTRYFKTEGKRAMFVPHEKIRRKMTKRDHKRFDSFHGVSSSVKNKDESSSQGSGQDDEKDPVLTPSEQERHRQESLAQRDNDLICGDGLQSARKNENIVQFIMRQNNKYRDALLDTYGNPQTHAIIVHAFSALQEMNSEPQLQAWTELLKRWQKFL